MGAPERAAAAAGDDADELGGFRSRFVVDDPTLLYVDGNSLGRLPVETAARVGRVVEDEWGRGLVGSWEQWIDRAHEVGDLIATGVVGAAGGEVVVSDSTTVNLYKLAVAALDARPEGQRTILTDDANFPTDRYVFEGIAASGRGRLRTFTSDPVDGPTVDDVAGALAGGDVGLVSLSHVAYRSGARADLTAITAVAHDAGALVLWDLSHSAGSVPVDLEAAGADLAVGCTYKYLNAGPGAPAFLYLRRQLQERMRQPIWGWFGQRAQFEMGPAYEPADGVGRFLVGTPSIVGMAAVEVGAGLVAEAGIERLAAKGAALTDLAIALHDEWLAPLGFSLGTPRDASRRGSHVSFRHPDAWPICRALIEEAQVVPDFRGPDSIRFGLPPLYTRFVDVWDAIDRLRQVVESGAHRKFAGTTRRVT